jgi:hypothetical protein
MQFGELLVGIVLIAAASVLGAIARPREGSKGLLPDELWLPWMGAASFGLLVPSRSEKGGARGARRRGLMR